MTRIRLLALLATLLPLVGTARAEAQNPPAVHTCTLLTPADAVPLLGVAKTSHGSTDGSLCTWGGAGSGPPNSHALMLTSPAQSAANATAYFQHMESTALKTHADRAQKESGMGDAAFSELTSYGCRIVVLKGGRTLQLQFTTGKPGTTAQLDLLRPIAKKAAAAM